MNPETKIERLLRARKQMERKLRELDKKVEHLIFLQRENRQCLARSCPLEEPEDQLNDFWY